jgi:hypothetical protein
MSAFFEDVEAPYLIGHVIAWVGLVLSLVVFVRLRPWRSRRIVARVAVRLFLLAWCITAISATLEGVFALLYDTTDSFNMLNTSQRWHRRHVRLNNMGFRDVKDFTAQRPPGQKRIVLMGDSFTFGHGISRVEDRLGDRIEARLEREFPGEFQFYDAARSGFDTEHHVDLVNTWRRIGFEADAIVLVYVLNDVEHLVPENNTIMHAKAMNVPSFWLWRETYFFNFLYYRWRQRSHPELSDYFSWLKDAYRGELWERERHRLDLYRATCQDQGTKLGVALFPFLHELGAGYSFREAHEALGEYWKERGVPVIDLLPVMESHADEGLMVNRFDAHPNARAHALAAEAIWDGVLRQIVDELRAPVSGEP